MFNCRTRRRAGPPSPITCSAQTLIAADLIEEAAATEAVTAMVAAEMIEEKVATRAVEAILAADVVEAKV
jgi:hypothetical protein